MDSMSIHEMMARRDVVSDKIDELNMKLKDLIDEEQYLEEAIRMKEERRPQSISSSFIPLTFSTNSRAMRSLNEAGRMGKQEDLRDVSPRIIGNAKIFGTAMISPMSHSQRRLDM